MIKPVQCYQQFGFDSKEIEKKWMVLWDVPAELEIGVIPKKIYCHKLMVEPLFNSFFELISSGCIKELKTWDGCYNPRPIRGYEKQFAYNMTIKNYQQAAAYTSMHYWGLAFDVNAPWNQLRQTPTLSPQFVDCFTRFGFDWGGNFKRLDGMHFQLNSLNIK